MKRKNTEASKTHVPTVLDLEFRQLFETLSKHELLYNPPVTKRTWRIRSLIREMRAAAAMGAKAT